MLTPFLFFMKPLFVMGPIFVITLLVLFANLVLKFMSHRWWWLIPVEVVVFIVFCFIYYNKAEPTRTYLDPMPKGATSLADVAREKQFHIGTIALIPGEDLYHQMVPSEFNSVTPGNHLKWKFLLKDGRVGEYDFSAADRLVDYAISQGARVRGHVLVWGQFEVPSDLEAILAAADDPRETLKQILKDHIFTTMRHFKGRIAQWDVLNEPLDYYKPQLVESLFMKTLGEDYIDLVFRYAREADPDCKLYLNEQLWSYTGEHSQLFLELLERLKKRGTPIDGIGLQAHINIPPLPTMEEMDNYLNQLAALGYEIEITEIDLLLRLFIDAEDPWQAQGDYAQQMVATCMQNPACTGITFWGISDQDNWYPHQLPYKIMGPFAPHLFDDTLNKKPAYYGVLKALQEGPNKAKE